MFFVVTGVVMLAMKLLEWGPAGRLDWIWVLSPFACALAWWQWCDVTGRSSRRAMERDAEKKAERKKRHVESLGTSRPRPGSRSRH